MFHQQINTFKIHLRFGFILRNRSANELRYFHSSQNVSGIYLDMPQLICNMNDSEHLIYNLPHDNILTWAMQRLGSQWICEMVTNVTSFINKILDHPIRLPPSPLPPSYTSLVDCSTLHSFVCYMASNTDSDISDSVHFLCSRGTESLPLI